MKKIFTIMLAAIMLLSFVACSGNGGGQTANVTTEPTEAPTAEPTEEPTEEPMPKIGETVHGKICDVTITSMEYVDKIKQGLVQSVWNGYYSDVTYKDVTAKEGYTILRINYSWVYTGKTVGKLVFDAELDFDHGFKFNQESKIGHVIPEASSVIMYGSEKYQGFEVMSHKIENALDQNTGRGYICIVVDERVKNDSDKSLVLNFSIPLDTSNSSAKEVYSFNLR